MRPPAGSELNPIGRKDAAVTVRGFFVGNLIAAGIVELAGAFAADTTAEKLQFLVLNLILGGAAGLSGGLLGFIFGIPRSLTDNGSSSSSPSDGPNRKSRPNTNLEQISDWLTKILVGATLTSLANVPEILKATILFLDAGAYKNLPGGGTLAVFVIIYFGALGFYWSYIETRTLLTLLFDTYNGQVADDILLKVRSAPREPGSPPIPEDQIILSLADSDLTTAALLEARAAAETRAKHYRAAIEFYRRALELDRGNPRIQDQLSMVLAAAGETGPANALVSKLQEAAGSNPGRRNLLEVNRVYTALYKPEPDGFEEAIRIGEPLLESDQAANGILQLWVACAYAQRFAYRKDGQDRVKALDCLRAMKRVAPHLVQLALSLWRPNEYGGDKNDNDLEVFRDDPDFASVLLGS